MKKSGFLTFICAIWPGCGQMYQGYMKRGLSLMFWFTAVIAVPVGVANFTHFHEINILTMFAAVVWAYSFFDAFNLRNLLPQQHAAMTDEFLPNGEWFNKKAMPKFKLNKILGWVLIVLGFLFIFNMFWDALYRLLWDISPMVAEWLGRIPGLIIAIVVICIGVYMLRGRKNTAQQQPEDATYYLPPRNTEGDNEQ